MLSDSSLDLDESRYLGATEFLDFESPEVNATARRWVGSAKTPDERAVRLYYQIRDKVIYDVYDADLTRGGMRASAVLERGAGFCIHKSILFVAMARCVGIPSRLGFADVRNHLSTARLRELVGGSVFRYHAYAEVWLHGNWLKITPVFNRTLCHLFGVEPLEFDGSNHAMLQAFDKKGNRYLELVTEHGSFDEFPYDVCMAALRLHHPRLFASKDRSTEGDLSKEASPASI